MRVSITLRLRESEVTSSSAWRTGMRWVRSPVAIAAAVSSIRVSGRKARRTANQASTSDADAARASRSARVVTSSRVTVWLTVLSGMPTANVASLPGDPPGDEAPLAARPASERTVNGSPLVTRGIVRRAGRAGRASS